MHFLLFCAILSQFILLLLCSWTTRAKQIVRMTVQHAWGLAKFVSLYKALLVLQKRMNGGKSRNSDTFFAGLIGGFLVFGERTAINEQVRLSSPFPYYLNHRRCTKHSGAYRLCYTSSRASFPPSFRATAPLHAQAARYPRPGCPHAPSSPTRASSRYLPPLRGVRSCGSSTTRARRSNRACGTP